MSKKSGKKFLGSKISRGVNNGALTPSGGKTIENTIETVIHSSTDAIINQLKKNEETNNLILTAVGKLQTPNVSSEIKAFRENVEDKMTAMLGVMYGFRGATNNMKSTQYLSMLSKIDPQVTANRGIYVAIKSIEDILTNNQQPSVENTIRSIDIPQTDITSIQDQLDVINDSIKNIKLKPVSISKLQKQLQSIESRIDITSALKIDELNEISNSIEHLINSVNSYNDNGLRKQLDYEFNTVISSIDSFKDYLKGQSINITTSNTSGEDINIAINVKGLDKDSLDKLIDIFKMQSTGDLDVSKLISNIQQFQEISKIPPVDYNVVTSITDMFETLKGIDSSNLNDIIDSINNVNINGLTSQLNSLNNINSGSFDNLCDLLDNYSSVINTVESLTKDKKGNARDIKLDAITNIADQIKNVVDNIQSISVNESDIKNTSEVGTLIGSVLGIQGFDKDKFKNLSSNLRKMIHLTEKPYKFLTAIGVSDRGLLWTLIHNISEASKAGTQEEKSVKGISNFIQTVIDIESSLDKKQLESFSNKLHVLNTVFGENGWLKTYQLINELPGDIDGNKLDDYKKLLSFINSLNDVIKLKSITSLITKVVATDALMLTLPITWKLIDNATKNIDETIVNIQKLHSVFDGLNSLDADKLKTVDAFVKAIGIVNISLSTAAMTAPFAYIGLVAMLGESTLLNNVIGKINDIDIAENTHEKMKDVAILVASCAGVLLLAAVTGQYVTTNLPNILGFSVALGSFILLTIGVLNISTRDMDEAKGNATEFAELLVVCGTVMLLGGVIMTAYPGLIVGSMLFAVSLGSFILATIGALNVATKNELVDVHDRLEDMFIIVGASAGLMLLGSAIFEIPGMFTNSLLFTTMLGSFILGVTYAYTFASNGLSDAMKYAEEFGVLIAISAACLLTAGALFIIDPRMIGTVLLFGVELAAFIGAVTFAYNSVGQGIAEAQKNAVNFGMLVALSGAILLLGGSIIYNNPQIALGILGFGVLLLGFVVGISFAYKVAASMTRDSINVAREFYVLVGLSAATLIIGGAFMMIPGLGTSALEFALLLGMFVVGMSLAFKLVASIDSKTTMPAAVALGVLTAISAATLLIGGTMLLNNEGLALASLEFAAITVGYVAVMSTAVFLLSKIKLTQLLSGVLALAGITLITYGMVKVMGELTNIDIDFMQCLKTLGMMTITITSIGVLIGVLGGICFTGVGAVMLASGSVALTAMIGIVMLAVEMVKGIASANNAIANMKHVDSDKVVDSVTSFAASLAAFDTLSNPLLVAKLTVAKINVAAISNCIGMIADAVKKISNLTIPLIENGKVVGVRTIDEADFQNAANNVESIITVLGSAIIETYNKNPNIFSTGSTLQDLLGMDTPFSKVCKSCATMGNMIAIIAKGVKQYADMRIDTYDEHGKKTGTRVLNEADFQNAANNVSTIITILGKAIIDTYNSPGAKEMFGWQLIGDNPFSMVVKSCTTMGNMISKVASAVRDYANLRVATYDKNGKVVGSREMAQDDFVNAGVNVSLILTTLGSAIMKTYNEHPEMFTDASTWHTDADKTPFGMVVKAMSGTGQLISGAAQAIKDVLALAIDWSEESKKTLANKVAFCIGVLSEAIYSLAVNENGEVNPAFKDESLWHNKPGDTPVGMVIGTLKGASALIKDGINIIQEITKLPNFDESVIRNRTALAIGVLASEITRLATDPKTKGAFEDDSWFHTDAKKTPIGMVKAALKGSGELVMEGVKAISEISKLNINDKTIGKVTSNIVSAIPNAILNATLMNPNEDIRDWWNDDPKEDFKTVTGAYSSMSKLLNQIIKTYSETNDLTNGKNGANIYLISSYLTHMLQAIPKALITANKYTIEAATLDNIVSSYDKYKDAVENILSIYKSTWNVFKKIGATDDEAVINMIGAGICRMTTYMMTSMSTVTSVGIDGLEEQVNGFAAAMSTYKEGITNLAKAFAAAPEETSKYNNMQKAIKGVNFEIANTPNLTQFSEETSLLKSYVRSVNSISTEKIDRLTNLANALTTMSTKLGSLEGLTDVLANKVSVVLSELTNRLDKSAAVINTAEKIQKVRHAKITDAMKQLKALMNKPLNVNVTHKQEQNSMLPDGGSSNDSNTGQQNGGTTGGTTNTAGGGSWGGYNTVGTNTSSRTTNNVSHNGTSNNNTKSNQPTSTTTGPSERYIRSVAREEVRDAMNKYAANNSNRGGGVRTGAMQR